MLFALTSENSVLDLENGTLYVYDGDIKDMKVYLRGDKDTIIIRVRPSGKYAEALWAYLKDNLKVKPNVE